jgi:hypothetical protein
LSPATKQLWNFRFGIVLTERLGLITVPINGAVRCGRLFVRRENTRQFGGAKRIEILKGGHFEMKTRPRVFSLLHWQLTFAAVLIPAGRTFAQDQTPRPADNIAMLSSIIIVFLAVYAYAALAVQTIARKTDTPNDWFAWIPIANLFLMLAIAKKPLWWFVLLLIPLVNVVITIIIWMGIAEARNKPSWWGILMLIPGVSLIVPGYLAWSE